MAGKCVETEQKRTNQPVHSWKKKPKIKFYKQKEKSSTIEDKEIAQLNELCSQFDSSNVATFADLPLSKKSLRGLKENGYTVPTEIQRESIGLALKELDILGAAKTGSGKTIAFLIPILDRLYKLKWSKVDGLAALVITPTRELAYQIFEVLRKIGKYHEFSAGLIIGGKDYKFETKRLHMCNIMICTPGRLLHHMDVNTELDSSSLQILVLDEADRILDLGFQQTMNAIIANLPSDRQTLLFSATQTKSVKDLARLSLKDPMYVSVHENAKHSTPISLTQSYIVCELQEKMDVLWSFIRHHLKQKILVFMSTCKQVKFAYEIFCRMRPGMTVLALHGSMHQMRRMAVYDDFCKKQNAVLLATDIAARGLDFPSVNWVIQMDCPEDANTYIHRVGRTARFEKNGEALLVLLPSEEEAMVNHLTDKKIPVAKIKVNPNKQQSVQRKMEPLLARDIALKDSAQRAFLTYLKAVYLMKDKKVFDVWKLDTDAFARSMGLAVTPKIRFLQKATKQLAAKEQKLSAKKDSIQRLRNASTDEESEMEDPKDSEESDDDQLLTIKRKIVYQSEDPESERANNNVNSEKSKVVKPITKASAAKKVLKKKIKTNIRTIFDEEGNEVLGEVPRQQLSEAAKALAETDLDHGGIDIEIAKAIMLEEDRMDKKLFHQRIKDMHKQQRLKEKQERRDESEAYKLAKQGYEGESESEEEGVQLNWLPDPDKVYGQKQSMDEDLCSDEKSNDGETIISEKALRKRKINAKTESSSKRKRIQELNEPLDTGLSLGDDEELALNLLKGSV